MDFLIYLVCFSVGLLFTLFSAVMGHLFGGHDGHDVGTGGQADAGFEHTGMPGVSPFSPTTIACFITGLGGLGMILSKIEATSSPFVSAPLSVLGGLTIAGAVLWGFNFVFSRTQSSSEAHVGELVGRTGTVITPIPEDGVGEVAYVLGGVRYTAPARCSQGTLIRTGAEVRVQRVVGSQLFVEDTVQVPKPS